ncbi:hypothetical protein TNCT_637101 [Trichonephila clavata]|uniref:Secreted protein n=1 Tax=Trichonephila clavata TaxID=2740835 RepID=A0A8X6GCA0_TRICU|nr:hypothetical protein TNCT_637101 [Trichonephila clavata]
MIITFVLFLEFSFFRSLDANVDGGGILPIYDPATNPRPDDEEPDSVEGGPWDLEFLIKNLRNTFKIQKKNKILVQFKTFPSQRS